MDAILNCNLDDMEDYYILLGCDELSTVEQILAEFKVKALECHPDKHPGNPKAVENFQKLQQAKEILTNEESRACYDYWRRSKITIPFQQWEALNNSIKTFMGVCLWATAVVTNGLSPPPSTASGHSWALYPV
ncbi:dnaJ homolog subfamily C member 12 isoform X2 [Trachemys scripta elegans]|uniref:dnaJ homolog subfamily C member 12 isoform X2 n=1 Tax=Trachemys scripta elegans TaxID=31138 RepID=UPI0015538DC6|nr:dnaJ homolog subfamily C member 12 isoform X2 [Trachemys scripta elegans]